MDEQMTPRQIKRWRVRFLKLHTMLYPHVDDLTRRSLYEAILHDRQLTVKQMVEDLRFIRANRNR